MKNDVFWSVAPCRWRFGGRYRLHLQGRKIRERETSMSTWLQSTRRHIPEDGILHLAFPRENLRSDKSKIFSVKILRTYSYILHLQRPQLLSVSTRWRYSSKRPRRITHVETYIILHYKYYVFGHYPSSCPFLKKPTTFRRLDSGFSGDRG
jgi:hypothetical protein